MFTEEEIDDERNRLLGLIDKEKFIENQRVIGITYSKKEYDLNESEISQCLQKIFKTVNVRLAHQAAGTAEQFLKVALEIAKLEAQELTINQEYSAELVKKENPEEVVRLYNSVFKEIVEKGI